MTEDDQLIFYMGPGAEGANPEHDALLRAHEAEADRLEAGGFWNYGKDTGDHHILSKMRAEPSAIRGLLSRLVSWMSH